MTTKQVLRQEALEKRKNLSPKTKRELDRKIFKNVINSKEFSNANLILTYLSTSLEIDTKEIIDFALKQGKIVAIPRCNEENELDFYKIDSLNGLSKTKIGILEPIANPQNKIVNFTNSICITPGLLFDEFGYRVGYGRGFYDKFLAKYSQKSIGLCYGENSLRHLPRDEHDKPVDIIVTESHAFYTIKN